MDLAIGRGTRSEIRDASTGIPIGKWIAPSGQSGKFAYHNCLTDAVWFFPALGSLAGGPNVVFSYIGQEVRNGLSVQHIQSYIHVPGPSVSRIPWQLSAIDFYLDASTFLPVAITFNSHPDGNAGTNLFIEIDFSNYQAINGVAVPMHIQRYQQGNLMLDLTITSVSFNTGLPQSLFAVN